EARNRALLYSPVEGCAELRQRWRQRQRPAGDAPASSLPTVVCGLTHGLSLVADLFCEEGRAVVVPSPFWGNYGQVFGLRRGGRLIAAPVYSTSGPRLDALTGVLAELPEGEPTIVLLNLPSNPVGYSLSAPEREEAVGILAAAADVRPLLVVCDDAYAGLVHEDDVPAASLFWDLVGRHPNLLPVKIDGCTKEIVFFGGRVAFVTFPFAPESATAQALESKAKCLVRATVGSPVSVSQELVLATLVDPASEAELAEVRSTLRARCLTLRRSLAQANGPLAPLPFNSGCFALLELPEGVDPEALRHRLLADFDTGVVAIRPRYARLAYCSVAEDAIPELVSRLGRALSSS
ncbi:MAG: aminotransferase class I/II-fold pyridoxal phosphate-dependent enzyme, partial [Thermoanaerobaculia bacterium]|nr:aminotransferase class I/II-fold pyridoxal phosphate-dependent enzyme [Thermoanaerobaculia bacterium]